MLHLLLVCLFSCMTKFLCFFFLHLIPLGSFKSAYPAKFKLSIVPLFERNSLSRSRESRMRLRAALLCVYVGVFRLGSVENLLFVGILHECVCMSVCFYVCVR